MDNMLTEYDPDVPDDFLAVARYKMHLKKLNNGVNWLEVYVTMNLSPSAIRRGKKIFVITDKAFPLLFLLIKD